ncbi:hypothetical protein QTN25_010723 [Entamoeba marina]
MHSNSNNFSHKTAVPFINSYPDESLDLFHSDNTTTTFTSSESTTPCLLFHYQQQSFDNDLNDSEGSSAITPRTYSADNEIRSILDQQMSASNSFDNTFQRSKHPAL